MVRARLGLAVVLAAAVSCGGSARQLEWTVSFAGGAAESDVRILRASIREGGCAGMEIYAASIRVLTVREHERDRLEHLCRYALRPPIALCRLKILGDDLIAIERERRWSDGTTHITMSVNTFLGRLASLVPRPRANTTIYAGVLAASSATAPPSSPARGPTASGDTTPRGLRS